MYKTHAHTDGLTGNLITLLLQGDFKSCLAFGVQVVHSVDDLQQFNLKVICPALYKLGELWKFGKITVAEEHQATDLVKRIMIVLHARFVNPVVTRGKVIVSASPNEHHEIGARMVADFLEIDGWEVVYLGANIPSGALLDLLKRKTPFLLALSAASELSLVSVRSFIEVVRADPKISVTKIMVGGYAFNNSRLLQWHQIGADGYAVDADGAVRVAAQWWSERTPALIKSEE